MTEITTLEQLRDALNATTEDDSIDYSSLPTFGGEEPAETAGIWSWDATSLLISRDGGKPFQIVPREEFGDAE